VALLLQFLLQLPQWSIWWTMVFCCLVGADYWLTVLDLLQTFLRVPQNDYCLLCLLALQHYLMTADVGLRSPAAVHLLPRCCCYCRCSSVAACGCATDTVFTTVVVHCSSDNGILLIPAYRVYHVLMLYICPQEEGAAYCQSLGCFPSIGPPIWSHCDDLNTMLSKIINWCSFCTYCLHCVYGILCSLEFWLYIGLIFILHLDILINIMFLVNCTHDKYLAQIVLCTRYCAPAWTLIFLKKVLLYI